MSKVSVRGVSRRAVLGGGALLPLAGVLADPILARAAAGSLVSVSTTTPSGRQVSGALAVPDAVPAPAIMLIHEWWGLNDQIKSVAREFANNGYLALAVDLYEGNVASTPEAARRLMATADVARNTETLVSWADWLRAHEKGTGALGTVGWCYGGGWSLNTSLATPVDATVIYYGRVDQPASELVSLKGPVLGHFATEDGFINKPMVEGFIGAMEKAGKSLTVHWYRANHAFANPTSARYDEEDAATAWRRTLAFFHETLAR